MKAFFFGRSGVCTYCGDPADTIDHVIAVSYQRVCRGGDLGPHCPACKLCNSKLSNRFFETFIERCQFVHDRLEKLCKPIVWTSYQIAAMDYGLKTLVRAEHRRRRWLRLRADYFESRDFYLGLEALIWEVPKLSQNGRESEFLRRYFAQAIFLCRESLRFDQCMSAY